MQLTVVSGQVFEFRDEEDGRTYVWDCGAARRLCQEREPVALDLGGCGLSDPATVASYYRGLDEGYAAGMPLGRLLEPLVLVAHREKNVLIDGWHRLWRAASEGLEVLPAWFLSQEEADSCLLGRG